MRKIIGALAACLITFASTAQTNILEQAGINNVQRCPGAVMEEGNNYYIARYAIKSEADTFIVPLHYVPIELSLWKYDKSTLQPISSVIVASDTLQSDSLSFNYLICYNKGRIHIVFTKFITNGGSNDTSFFYYTQLDTNLNIVVPQKRIATQHNLEVDVCLIGMHNDNVLYCTSYMGNELGENINRYYIIDTLGDVVQQDTLGYPPPPEFYTTWIYNVSRYKENQYLVTGRNLLGTSLNTYMDNSFVADSAMNITDTFRNVPIGAHAAIAALPTGSFFSNIAYNKSVLIEKHFGNRFDSSKHIQSYGIDSNDLEHPQTGIYYNDYDNKVYAVNCTHKENNINDNVCAFLAWPDLLPYNYSEITCLDTNASRLWRKYIKVDFQTGGCSALLSGIVPDEREGISVIGEWHNSNWNGTGADTLRQFMYYITANTVTDSTIIGNPTAIHQPAIEIRDRIKIYPNPATDMVCIDDIEGKLSEIELYDVQGRLIIKQQASGSKTSVNIATLPPGLYLVKVTMKDGEMMQKKIIK